MKFPQVSKQFLTFVAIGVGNTLLDLALFLLFVQVLPIPLATFFSSSICMTISFLANGRLTFSGGRTRRQFFLFVAGTGTVLWLIQPLLILAGREVIGGEASNMELAGLKLVATGFCTVLNFLSYRYIVWPLAGAPLTEDEAGDTVAP